MDPVITTRHCDVEPELRTRAASITRRIGSLAGRPTEAAVVFSFDAGTATAELRLHNAAGEAFVARGEGPDHRTALDRAEDRLRRQVARASGRTRDGRHSAELNQV